MSAKNVINARFGGLGIGFRRVGKQDRWHIIRHRGQCFNNIMAIVQMGIIDAGQPDFSPVFAYRDRLVQEHVDAGVLKDGSKLDKIVVSQYSVSPEGRRDRPDESFGPLQGRRKTAGGIWHW